jgi:hypothetical protein
MFENFGLFDAGGKLEFKIFYPGGELVKQGGNPQVESIHVYGDFQGALGIAPWKSEKGLQLSREDTANGTLFSCTTGGLPDGSYQYKYLVKFNNGEVRIVGDPCARYNGYLSPLGF